MLIDEVQCNFQDTRYVNIILSAHYNAVTGSKWPGCERMGLPVPGHGVSRLWQWPGCDLAHFLAFLNLRQYICLTFLQNGGNDSYLTVVFWYCVKRIVQSWYSLVAQEIEVFIFTFVIPIDDDLCLWRPNMPVRLTRSFSPETVFG